MPTPQETERPTQFSLEVLADDLLLRLTREKRDLVNTALADGGILSLFCNVKPRVSIAVLLLKKDGTTQEMGRFGVREPAEE